MTRGSILTVLVLAAAGGALYATDNHHKLIELITHRKASVQRDTQVAPPSVTVARVQYADFVETVRVTGSLVAREEILVSPEIEGFRIVEILADQGDTVKKGDVLARLETETLEAQLAQNSAALKRSEASMAQARSQIAEVEARLTEAKRALDRAKPLSKSGYLSESTLDQRAAAASSATAQLAAAKDALTAAEAERTQIEAQRRELIWRREKAEVRAPTNGLVSRRAARIGTVFSSMAPTGAEPMFRIIENGEVELDAEITELDLQRIKPGQDARILVAGGIEVSGTVRLVSPEVDSTTRLGRVKLFIGAEDRLRVGSFASGLIETARVRGLAVPVSAVSTEADTATALVLSGDIVEARSVKTGLSSGGLVEVQSGLKEDDRVVARAGTFLNSGDQVRPVEARTEKVSTAQ